jgi:hypothetical protein
MRGGRDTNSQGPFSCDYEAALRNLKPGLFTRSTTQKTAAFADLRIFITARGGTVSGEQLVTFVLTYIYLRKEIPPILVDR